MANIISRGINRLRNLFEISTKQKNITESLFNYRSGLNVANDELAGKITNFVNGQSTLLNFDETGDQLYRQMVRNATSGAKTYDEAMDKIVSAVDDLAKEHYGSMYNVSSYGQDEATKEVYKNLFGASSRETNSGIENSLDEILNIKYDDNKDLPNRISPSERRSMDIRRQALVNGGIENRAVIRDQALENVRKTYVDQQKLQTGTKRHSKVNSSKVETESRVRQSQTSSNSKSTESTFSSEANNKSSTTNDGPSENSINGPSDGSTESSTKQSGPIFVSKDDPRIGTIDENDRLYMPDDISGGGISAGAKQHAYQKAYDKAAGSQKWQDEQIEKIKSAEQPQNMSDEEWQKAQQEQINAVNKQADKMRNDWSTMQKDSTKINPGLSDYVLGNPHTTAGVLGGGTLGYLALQLSDSRGQMTNQQLYGQDDLT